ncbi:MAG: pilus assembly protein PilM [Patescibacteria group bacterium]
MKFGFLSKHFPLEKFLKPSCIGISFSDENIKAVLLNNLSSKPSLKSAIMPIEKGSIINGRIINAAEVTKKLSIMRKDFNLPFVFFTVPDELAYVFSTTILVSEKSNANDNIASIIEENVPLTLDDAVFDFVPIKVVRSDVEYSASVVVAACVKQEVEKFIQVFRKAEFEPIGCIHESQAITNALTSKKSSGTLCIVHARGTRIGIYLVKDNLVIFSTLRSVLEEDYKKQFLDEYDKFLEYCMKYATDGGQTIKSVLVCGEFEYAKKVVEAINDSKNNGEDVKLSNVWTNVFEINKHLPDVPYEKSLSFAGPIGAALSEII